MGLEDFGNQDDSRDQQFDLLNRYKRILAGASSSGPQRQPWDERLPDGQMPGMPPVRIAPLAQRNSAMPQIQPASGQQDPARLNPRNKLQAGDLQLSPSTEETSTNASAPQQPATTQQSASRPTTPAQTPVDAQQKMPPIRAAALPGPLAQLRANPGNLLVGDWRGQPSNGQEPSSPNAEENAPTNPGATVQPSTKNGIAQQLPMPPIPMTTAEQRLAQLQSQTRPELHGFKKALDIVSRLTVPGIEENIPGTPGNYDARLAMAEAQAKPAIDQRHQTIEDQRNWLNTQSEVTDRAAQQRLREQQAQPDNPTDKKIDEYVNAQNQRVLTFQRPNGEVYDRIGGATQQKTDKFTNPFEAFAYGSAQEKQAAQDFLEFEKKTGSKYEKPGEVEQRYELYQRDPEAYKAMFGDRGAAQDSTNARGMLNYFNRRRQEIQNDWTLDEKQKADQLAEIDQLSAPHLNAAQPGGANKGGGAEDRVTVRDKNGNVGTVPQSNLKKALKNGYSVDQ